MTPIESYLKSNNEDFLSALSRVDDLLDKAASRLVNEGYHELYVGHSGGKDSVLVRYIADLVDVNIPTLHTPKINGENAVHPLTKEFLYSLSTQRDIIYCKGNPKEVYGFSTQIDGTRRAEFNREDGRSTYVVINGKEVSREEMPVYVKNGLFGLNFIYPIVDFTDEEVWAIIHSKKIPFSEEYNI